MSKRIDPVRFEQLAQAARLAAVEQIAAHVAVQSANDRKAKADEALAEAARAIRNYTAECVGLLLPSPKI